MPYDEKLVAPMREEVRQLGAKELRTVAEVDQALGDAKGTTLVFVNSVCGCAAGGARPALQAALKHTVLPQTVVTVFAGQTSKPPVAPASTSQSTSPAHLLRLASGW